MKRYIKNRTSLAITIIFALYSAILAFCNILGGDDIIWTLEESKNDVFGKTSVNGRYLTNFITFYAVRSFLLRTAVAFVFVFLLHQLLLRVIDTEKGVPGWAASPSRRMVFSSMIPTCLAFIRHSLPIPWP